MVDTTFSGAHLHIIEVEGRGLHLPGVALGRVLHVEDLLLPVLGVVVEAQLKEETVMTRGSSEDYI